MKDVSVKPTTHPLTVEFSISEVIELRNFLGKLSGVFLQSVVGDDYYYISEITDNLYSILCNHIEEGNTDED